MTPLESSDPRTIPPFDIRGRLGAGGMGVVYAALSPDDRWVAVKVIRPEFADDQVFRRRFAREVQLMSRIRARCIASVLAYDTSAEQPWFATAFLPGPTLNVRVRSEGPLPEAQARVLGVGMAEGIAAIHAAGVVHRDLKPSNVILAPDGPKVLDFGIAHAVDGTQLTRTGGLMGSPGWMSPERFRGGAGPAADVFSWGALVTYAVTGRSPFGTGSAEELMFRLLSEEPDLSGVPEGLREVVARALAKAPEDRPSSADLVRSLAGENGEGSAPASPDEMATMVSALIDQDWPGPHTPPPEESEAAAPPSPSPAPPAPGQPTPFQGQHPGQPRAQPQSPQVLQDQPPARFQQQGPEYPSGSASQPAPPAGTGSGSAPPSSVPPGPPVGPPSPPPTPARASRPLRGLLAVVATLLLIGGVTGWLLLRDGEGEQMADDGGAEVLEGAAEDQSDPFVFATAGQISSLDPFLATDGDTFRYSRQVFETLLRHDPADGQIVGGLAHDWEHSDDGTEWTFHLRKGVRFHDGDDLTAEAVCANFDRWYNTTGVYRRSEYTWYWQSVFGGFMNNLSDLPEPNYVSCEALDGLTAVITVDEYSPALPGGFTLASFGLMSPTTVAEIADEAYVGPLADYSSNPEILAGTGPFRLSGWDDTEKTVSLNRFEDHWDASPGVETLVMGDMADEAARRQALEAGEIHGYDLVNTEDLAPLRQAGYQVPSRDPINLLYLGYQQEAHEALEVPEVREALAHAVNRERVVDTTLPEGSEVATQFVPETVNGWSPNARTVEHSPDLAEELLADAGHEDLALEFCYPNDVTRTYMPDPEGIHRLITQDLKNAGVSLELVDYPWSDYVSAIHAGDCPLYLYGWTGHYNEPHNFLGPYFSEYNQMFGYENEDLFEAMDGAAALPDDGERFAAYQEVNEQLMEYLPGLPIAHTPSVTVFSPDVSPPAMGPLPAHENFSEAFWK
ncbi:ABC transporter substrate-binding protein [Nocardiopsis ganjiahuensis]|uniref:ABC transporter substrate-binding protein n=1 Tax=Nocardiopsis ganjiahuensis TaxID=239984 RepID=UPI0009FF66B5|nr:ABC transporter substrate-binding protein [Nocardiopsis ganjiahuensis]